MKIGVLLTQWKRSHLESQLINIYNQTIKPDLLATMHHGYTVLWYSDFQTSSGFPAGFPNYPGEHHRNTY